MGLYIHSLTRLPKDIEREYYIYLLDYGWENSFTTKFHQNFAKIADLAAKGNSVVIAGTVPRQFLDETASIHFDTPVLSWNDVFGIKGEDVLPALMVTTAHPSVFLQNQDRVHLSGMDIFGWANEKVILIPIDAHCKTEGDLFGLVERLFRDIYKNKSLSDFEIISEIKRKRHAHSPEIVVLKPGAYGIYLDLKQLWKSGKRRLLGSER